MNWSFFLHTPDRCPVCRADESGLAQDSRTRHDVAHTVRVVSVRDGTRPEVLDWGRTGRPLVLLAGSQKLHACSSPLSRTAYASNPRMYGMFGGRSPLLNCGPRVDR